MDAWSDYVNTPQLEGEDLAGLDWRRERNSNKARKAASLPELASIDLTECPQKCPLGERVHTNVSRSSQGASSQITRSRIFAEHRRFVRFRFVLPVWGLPLASECQD